MPGSPPRLPYRSLTGPPVFDPGCHMAERKNFGKLQDVLDIPDLIAIQLESYKQFLQEGVAVDDRANQGMQEVFKEIFPIESFDGSFALDYVSYEIGEAKLGVVECIRSGKSYAVPLYVTLRLENRKKQDVKEEKVFLGDMPLMTERGTFIINGAERVIISQLHRSPGICFEKARHTTGKILWSFRVIPDRGNWLEVQFDINDQIFIYLDRRRRRRKFLISTFLRAVGCPTNRELLDAVYGIQKLAPTELGAMEPKELAKYYLAVTVTDAAGTPLKDAKGAKLAEEMHQATPELMQALKAKGVTAVEVVYTENMGPHFIKCVEADPCKDADEALK
jgi:DNA-directed RNA polymerase subunit beta